MPKTKKTMCKYADEKKCQQGVFCKFWLMEKERGEDWKTTEGRPWFREVEDHGTSSGPLPDRLLLCKRWHADEDCRYAHGDEEQRRRKKEEAHIFL
jgi:hypothetical protein